MWKARGNPADACDRPGLLVETARQCLAGAITIHPAGWGAARLLITDILVPGWVYKCAYNESNILSSIITSRRAWQFGDHVKPQHSVAIELMLPQILQEHHSKNAPI